MAVRVMDRPKHRWLIISGLVVGLGLLLLTRPWMSTTVPARAPATVASTQLVEAQPDQAEPPSAAPIAAPTPGATPAASPPPAANGTFRGHVIDAVTRQPVPEFEVRLERVQRGMVREAETPVMQNFQSKSGRFAWKQAPAGEWQVTVAARGYQPFKVAELQIDAGKTTRELVLPMMRGYTLRGRVFEASSGTGIAEASIGFRELSVWSGSGPGFGRYEKTDTDGSFEIQGVPGGDIKLTAYAQKHASREIEVLVQEDTPPIEIGLTTGGSIAGFVVDAGGKPVAGIILLSGPEEVGHINKLDDTGTFSFEHRRAGRHVISANTSAGNAKQEIVLEEDEHREGIVLTVGGGRSIRGVITGLRPDQLKGAFVSLQPESRSGYFSAQVDEQGAYAIGGVPPGRARFTAHAASMSRQLFRTVDVPTDKDVVLDIVFAPGARLSGRITQGGKPAHGKGVWMAPVEDESRLYRARTAEDGRYEIEGLPTGEYRLRADEDVGRTITIAGDVTLDIDIPLLQIGGRVIEDGAAFPIVGADVYFRGTEAATARVRGHRETDHFGKFKLTGLEPGEVTLTVYKPGYEIHRERIAYASPLPNQTIKLRRSSGIEIRVKRAGDGEPLNGVMLSEKIDGHDWAIDLWIPLNREGIGSVPSALVGSTFAIYASREPIVVREWDGRPLEIGF